MTMDIERVSTMDTTRSRDWHPLTSDEVDRYRRDGFLHLRGVFTSEEVERGLDIVEEALSLGGSPVDRHDSFLDFDHTIRIRNAVSQSAEIDYFLDHPALIGPLMTMLNHSVHILGSEIFVRSLDDGPLEYWHTDGGEYLQRICLSPDSPDLQIKAQVFLTDVSESNSGNFLLIPGSHRRLPPEQNSLCYMEELDEPLRRGVLPPDAVEVKAEAGDVLLFPYSLWHAVGPNTRRIRKSFIFRFGQLWHRPHDYLQQSPEVIARMSPRLRRMFGDFGADVHPSDFYKPVDQGDVMAVGNGHVVD